MKIGRNYPIHKFYSRYWKNWEKNTLDIPELNYPVFLILYLLFFSYFCRNAFCWLCQEATNIIRKVTRQMIEPFINKIGIGTGKLLKILFSKRRCLSYLVKMRMKMGTTFTSTAPQKNAKLFQTHLHGSQRI